MTLFTGAAILEEKFVTAYFRFNDDTFAELKPSLRPAEHAQEFVTQWDGDRPQSGGNRCIAAASQFQPFPAGIRSGRQPQSRNLMASRTTIACCMRECRDRSLGIFDLYFDSLAAEQVWAGQLKTVDGETHYDVWSCILRRPTCRAFRRRERRYGRRSQARHDQVSQYKIQAKVAPPTRLDADASLQLEVRQGGQRAALFELSRFLQINTGGGGWPAGGVHPQPGARRDAAGAARQ